MSLPTGSEKRVHVQDMFDRIAPRYDRMNRLITAGLDQRWRHRLLDAIGVGAGDRVLDLACGTGDLSELASARGAAVLGIDFSLEMLRGARKREIDAAFVQADGTSYPLRDGWATALTCGFALRNFVALPTIFAEAARVLEPGGRFYAEEVLRRFILNPVVRGLLEHPLEDRFDADTFAREIRATGFGPVVREELWRSFGWFTASKTAAG